MEQFSAIFSKARWLLVGLVVLIGMLGTFSSLVLYAQESTPLPTVLDAVPVRDDVSADEINAVARELWCPLCSGVRLDACELKACQQMKEMIGLKLAEGQDLDSIRTYFVAQYGPQVLGEPPWHGINWLAWVLPFVVLAIGGYFLWHTVRRMVRTAPAPTPSALAGQTTTPGAPAADDEYGDKLAEELKRYG